MRYLNITPSSQPDESPTLQDRFEEELLLTGEAHESTEIETVIEALINESNFTEAFIALLNPKTSLNELEHFRDYTNRVTAGARVYQEYGEWPDVPLDLEVAA